MDNKVYWNSDFRRGCFRNERGYPCRDPRRHF